MIGLTLGYGFYIEPNSVQINTVQIKTRSKDNPFIGKTILHLTDLHLSKLERFEKTILRNIDQLNPDLIFLTGDYIQWKGDNQAALQFLSQLSAKYGVYAVMGDYDYSNSRQSCLFCHKANTGILQPVHKVNMIRNKAIWLSIQGEKICVFGIDGGNQKFKRQYGKVTTKGRFIKMILSHSPLNFDAFSNDENILMFSGDTHGGQTFLPGWVYKLFGYTKNARYNYGLYEKDQKKMFVSRGLGTSHIKFRIGSPPEIAVIRFEYE